MKIKNMFLFSLVLAASCTKINTMNDQEKEKFFISKDHLITIFEREKAETRLSEQLPEVQAGYQRYQNIINSCPHPRTLEETVPHPKESPCVNCKAAYDDADQSTKILINQKGFENEVQNALADLIDFEGYIKK